MQLIQANDNVWKIWEPKDQQVPQGLWSLLHNVTEQLHPKYNSPVQVDITFSEEIYNKLEHQVDAILD